MRARRPHPDLVLYVTIDTSNRHRGQKENVQSTAIPNWPVERVDRRHRRLFGRRDNDLPVYGRGLGNQAVA